MKRLLLALAMLFVFALPIRNAEADTLIGNATEACVLGAVAFGTATYVGWLPALTSGVLTVQISQIVAANALIGCGVGFAGVITASLIDRVFTRNEIVIR